MRLNPMKWAVIAVAALGASSQAAVIAGYDFGPDASHLTLAATAVDANATATAINPSSSTNVSISTINGSSYYGTGSTIMTFSRLVTNTSVQYITFTVTPTNGYVLNLTSLTFNAAMGGASGPRTVSVANSVTGTDLASALAATPALQARGTFTGYTYDYSGASYQGLTGFTVRFYFDTPTPSQNIDMDSIVLNGTLTAVPEPASVGVSSLLAAGMLLRRRK